MVCSLNPVEKSELSMVRSLNPVEKPELSMVCLRLKSKHRIESIRAQVSTIDIYGFLRFLSSLVYKAEAGSQDKVNLIFGQFLKNLKKFF
jgi:hypothetical protein